MKKLISLTILLFATIILKAQTADETLEWLRAKQPAINGNAIMIDTNAIHKTSDEKLVKIEWAKIKDITTRSSEITVVGNQLIDGKNVFIRFVIDFKIVDKYANALRHFAELKSSLDNPLPFVLNKWNLLS